MRRIKKQMHRYGEPDFDKDYLNWGFPDPKTQADEAESVLRLLGQPGPHKILDIACGIGTHAVCWGNKGHEVLGIDISETFVDRARQSASGLPQVKFLVCDMRSLDLPREFTAATWIEMSLLDLDVFRRIHRTLKPGGCFICDVRNPEHPKIKAHSGNWRSWREDNGVFKLESHGIDPKSGKQEDVWITIDPQRDAIEESSNISEPGLKTDPSKTISLLQEAGFSQCTLRTMSGDLFQGGPEPYWLWVVAQA